MNLKLARGGRSGRGLWHYRYPHDFKHSLCGRPICASPDDTNIEEVFWDSGRDLCAHCIRLQKEMLSPQIGEEESDELWPRTESENWR